MMLLPDLTCRLVLDWLDNEGQIGRTTFRLPFITSADAAISAGNALASAISNLTLAKLKGIHVYYAWNEDATLLPDIDSDVTRLMVLFYRTGDRYEQVSIPSGNAALTEEQGILAGVRLDATNPQVEAAITALQPLLVQLVTPEGEVFPDEYISGGIAL